MQGNVMVVWRFCELLRVCTRACKAIFTVRNARCLTFLNVCSHHVAVMHANHKCHGSSATKHMHGTALCQLLLKHIKKYLPRPSAASQRHWQEIMKMDWMYNIRTHDYENESFSIYHFDVQSYFTTLLNYNLNTRMQNTPNRILMYSQILTFKLILYLSPTYTPNWYKSK